MIYKRFIHLIRIIKNEKNTMDWSEKNNVLKLTYLRASITDEYILSWIEKLKN